MSAAGLFWLFLAAFFAVLVGWLVVGAVALTETMHEVRRMERAAGVGTDQARVAASRRTSNSNPL